MLHWSIICICFLLSSRIVIPKLWKFGARNISSFLLYGASFPVKKWPTITNSQLRMSKFPAVAIPAVAVNTWINNNMGVALKKELSRPLSQENSRWRNVLWLQSPLWDFLKITKILGLIPPYPPPLLIGTSVIPPCPSLENHLWLCCCEIFLYLLQNILIFVFILLFVSYLRKNIGYTKNSYM